MQMSLLASATVSSRNSKRGEFRPRFALDRAVAGLMFYQAASKLFRHHGFAGHGNLLGPPLINPDSIAAGSGKGEIDQFNVEPVPGLRVNEFERIMRIWGGHSPSWRPHPNDQIQIQPESVPNARARARA